MKIVAFYTARSLSILLACLITFLVLIMVLSTDQTPRLRLIGEFSKALIQGGTPQSSILSHTDTDDNLPQYQAMDEDKFLGGLIAPGFDEWSCISRYQSALYRKASPHKPSPYLVSKLRDYEDLHKRCGPYTKFYNLTLGQLKSDRSGASPTDCNYVVWADCSGLGNKILSLASAFLYAFLTNRVLLIEQKQDMANLFCEPFLNSSWILPSDFPIRLSEMGRRHGNCYGWMLRGNKVNTSSTEWPPSFLYIHLTHDYSYHDKLFFCDEHQMALSNVPWLIMKSNLYYIPPLFAIPSFQNELDKLFPDKETVFHHLGRYLLHPSNQVWGLITRFYLAYLARADEIVGIQIRVFEKGTNPLPYVMDQIKSCTVKEKILPALDPSATVASSFYNKSLKAVLVTSLYSSYHDHMRNLYLSEPTVSMEVVGFHQPSHEERQLFGNSRQNMKAWSEMYLLSMCDVLVTTSWSTFGYVANSLGGLRPWILNKPENRTTPDPPCQRARSMEPCLQAPPHRNCRARAQNSSVDVGKFLRSCEEGYGIKLYHGN